MHREACATRHRYAVVRGLPLIHDKTVDEWATEVFGYLMAGPPAHLPTAEKPGPPQLRIRAMMGPQKERSGLRKG